MRLFAVSGFSKTGKTTTIASIINEFVARGYGVGTIKDSHCQKLSMDKEGSDTFIHRMAGAGQVTLRAPGETNIMYPVRLDLKEILSYYDQDIVILEGFANYDLPKIVTGIIPFDVQAKKTAHTFAVSGIISEQIDVYQGLPVINGLKAPNHLCDVILAKVKDIPLATLNVPQIEAI